MFENSKDTTFLIRRKDFKQSQCHAKPPNLEAQEPPPLLQKILS